ncbi:hypothetical protein QJQ45_001155 [Haematococcus lacustris]|nr:hypothetical protein QJQ45_001155 [Haematococcus lacustris]
MQHARAMPTLACTAHIASMVIALGVVPASVVVLGNYIAMFCFLHRAYIQGTCYSTPFLTILAATMTLGPFLPYLWHQPGRVHPSSSISSSSISSSSSNCGIQSSTQGLLPSSANEPHIVASLTRATASQPRAAVLASVANATALVRRALPQYQSRHKLTQVTLKLHQQHPEQLRGDVPEHLARILEDPSARSKFITSSAKPLLACDAVLLASVCVRPGCTLVVISLCQLTPPAGGSQQDSLLGSPLLTWLSGPGLMQTDTSAPSSPPTAPANTDVSRPSSQQLGGQQGERGQGLRGAGEQAKGCGQEGQLALPLGASNVQRWVQALLGAEQLQALQGQQGREAGGQGDELPLQITAQFHQSLTHFEWDRDQQVWGSTPLPLTPSCRSSMTTNSTAPDHSSSSSPPPPRHDASSSLPYPHQQPACLSAATMSAAHPYDSVTTPSPIPIAAIAEPSICTAPSPSPFAAEGAQAVREEQAAATLSAWPCVMSLPQPQPDLLTPPGAVGMTMVVQVLVHDMPWKQQQQGVQVAAGSSWPSLPPGWRIEARLSSGVALAAEEAVEEAVETAAAEAAAEGGSEAAAGPSMWTGVDACTTGAAPGGKAIKVRLHLPPCPLPAGCLVVLELWQEVPLTPPASNLANSTIASGNGVSSGTSSAAPSPATVPSLVSQAPLLLIPAPTAASTAAALPGALPASCPGALTGAVAEQRAPERSLLDELLGVTTAAERAAGVTLAADGAGTAALLQDLGAWLDWTQALAITVEDRQSCTQHPALPASLPPTAHDRVTPSPAPPPWGQAGMPSNPDWGNTCAGSARLNALNPSYCHLMLCVVADMAAFAQAEACPALLGWLEQGTRQVLPAIHALHPGLVAALVSKQEREQGLVSGLEVEALAGRGAGAGASGVTAADTMAGAEAGSAGVRAQAGAGSGTTGPLQAKPAGQSSLSSGTSSSSSSATLLVTLFPTFPAQGVWLQPAWSAGRAALRQLVWGFPEPGLEASYRAWLAGRASAPLRVALLLMVLIIAVTLPKSWAAGCFLYDCCYYAAYITPHLQASPLHCVAHDLLRVSNHGRLQLAGLGCTVVRAAMVVLSALGVLRWPAGTVFSAQQGVDYWLEGIIILGQQLTLGPMLFQLACTYCAAVTLDASLGLPRPWLRSLLVVGVSCVIGVVMDLRRRASFAARAGEEAEGTVSS